MVNVVICEKGAGALPTSTASFCDNLFDWTRTLSSEELAAFNEALETIVRLLGKQPDVA